MIALSVLIQADSDSPSREDALGSPALNEFPKTGACVDPSNTRGEDDEEFDVQAIADRVERLRNLDFRSEPRIEVVSVEEIDRRIAELFERTYKPGLEDTENRLLTAIGAIPRGTDLGELYSTSLTGQIAGLYDPKDKSLLVVGEQDDPGVIERVVLAHELEHALADQALGLPAQKADPSRGDSLLAEAALVEGDASLVEELYVIRHVGVGDLFGAIAGLGAFDVEELTTLPDYLQRELVFPYVAGAEFVCALYLRGGWREVDRAYRRPPRTTAEILFPERYGEPIEDPRDPAAPGPGWRLELSGEFGAAPLQWLLKAPGGRVARAVPRARAAAEAWAGGEFTLWSMGAETAMGIALAERAESPRALCVAVAGWYAAAFPSSSRPEPAARERLVFDDRQQDAVLRCEPGEVRLGIGPDVSTARRVAGPG